MKTTPDVTPEHAEAIKRAADLLRLFLETRPMAEALMFAGGIKALALSDPEGMTHGWLIGVRRRQLGVVMASMDQGGGAP